MSQSKQHIIPIWAYVVGGVLLALGVICVLFSSAPKRTGGELTSSVLVGYYGTLGPDGRQWVLELRRDGTYQFNGIPHFPSTGQWCLLRSPHGYWEIELESYGSLPIFNKLPPYQIRFCYGDPDVDIMFLKYLGKPSTTVD